MGLIIRTTGLDEYAPGGEAVLKMMLIGGPSSGKCAGLSTYVPLADGRVRQLGQLLDDREFQPEAITLDEHSLRLRSLRAENILLRDEDDVVEVRFASGRSIMVTPDHRFFDGDRWLAIEDVPIGGLLATPRSLPCFGSQPLPDVDVDLLGLLVADGGLTIEGRISYTKVDCDLIDLAQRTGASYGARLVRNSALGPACEWRYNGASLLWNTMASYGVTGHAARTKAIPDAIFTAPREELARFLAVLWSGDGSIDARNRITYSTSSAELARQVQHLWLRFGVVAKCRSRRTSAVAGGPLFDSWELEVYGFAAQAFCAAFGHLAVGEKAKRLLGADLAPVRSGTDILPPTAQELFSGRLSRGQRAQGFRPRAGRMVTRAMAKRYAESPEEPVARPGRRRLSDDVIAAIRERGGRMTHAQIAAQVGVTGGTVSRVLADKVIWVPMPVIEDRRLEAARWASSDVFWDEIVSIEPAGRHVTACLQMPAASPNFVANDLIIHNTRLSSYWPKPIYADSEAGLSSIADRGMPYVSVKSSGDMLDLLTYLKTDRRPYRDKDYQTVVVDTLDAFQRKVKDEWLQANPGAQSFRGFDAWGFLDAKMQMLLTRLLNLDINVIVNVHYKDRVIREGTGESATERQELMLQLSGDVKDSVFNDFDLVGWLGKYYEAVDGQRVEKRGLTFKSTPDKPFLKDRLHVTPPWMEVKFSDEDYATLFSAFASRLDDLKEGREIGEIPSAGGGVVGPVASGALSVQDPREVPLAQFDKPTLVKMARDLGLDFKGNTIKAELIQMIEAKQAEAKQAESKQQVEAETAETKVDDVDEKSASVAVDDTAVHTKDAPAPAAKALMPSFEGPAAVLEEDSKVAPIPVIPEQREEPEDPSAASTGVEPAPVASLPTVPTTVTTEAGEVDPGTGEITEQQAVANAVTGLGATVLSPPEGVDSSVVSPPAAPAQPAQSAVVAEAVCQDCGKPLVGENQDYVKLAWIKYRAKLCNESYLSRKKASA